MKAALSHWHQMLHTTDVNNSIDDPEFQALQSMPRAVLWTMALTGEITEISPSIEQVRGLTPDQAKNQSADQIHPPEALSISLSYFEHFSRAILAGEVPKSFRADLGYYHADGSIVMCDVMAVPVVDDSGAVIELRGVSVPE
jgi:PAS domain S-box-containing protein